MKSLIVIAVIIALVVLAFVFSGETSESGDGTMSDQDTTEEMDKEMEDEDEAIVAPENTPVTVPKSTVRVFNVTGKNFEFSTQQITVSKGDTVRINFESTEGNHNWVIDEFGARTKVVNTGSATSVEFVADKSGQFEYYCSVGSHRALGMVGTLVVQ